MKENVVQSKSYEFAKKIVFLYQDLKKKNEFELASQLLRSGTSIGANIEEAIGGYSKKDFLHKITISYKEARETKFWLRLLRDTNIINEGISKDYLDDCDELLRILGSIQKSSKSADS
jgi:four helix bundle protein